MLTGLRKFFNSKNNEVNKLREALHETQALLDWERDTKQLLINSQEEDIKSLRNSFKEACKHMVMQGDLMEKATEDMMRFFQQKS